MQLIFVDYSTARPCITQLLAIPDAKIIVFVSEESVIPEADWCNPRLTLLRLPPKNPAGLAFYIAYYLGRELERNPLASSEVLTTNKRLVQLTRPVASNALNKVKAPPKKTTKIVYEAALLAQNTKTAHQLLAWIAKQLKKSNPSTPRSLHKHFNNITHAAIRRDDFIKSLNSPIHAVRELVTACVTRHGKLWIISNSVPIKLINSQLFELTS